MELWIRSQKNINIDSRLLMATEIALDYCGENDGYFVLVDSIEVAYYNTEERALEVLDEIQNILKPITIFKNAEISKETWEEIQKVGVCTINDRADVIKLDTFVYEMPNE